MTNMEAGLLAFIAALLVPVLAYKAVAAYLANPHPWSSAGYAVLAAILLFGLWWLLQKDDPTGLQLSRKTTAKLEEEDADRATGVSLSWLLFGSAVVLVLAVMMSGAA